MTRYTLGIFTKGKLVEPVLVRLLSPSAFIEAFFEWMAASLEDAKIDLPEGYYIAWDKS